MYADYIESCTEYAQDLAVEADGSRKLRRIMELYGPDDPMAEHEFRQFLEDYIEQQLKKERHPERAMEIFRKLLDHADIEMIIADAMASV